MSDQLTGAQPSTKDSLVGQWGHMFRGMVRLWCYDLGCASFIFTGMLGIFMGTLFAIRGNEDGFELLFSMGITSFATAISWQFNRLAATEWASLVPHYRRNILLQAACIFAAVLALGIGLCVIFANTQVLASLSLACGLSLGFVVLTLLRSQNFYFSFALFVVLPFIPMVSGMIPLALSGSVTIALLVVIFRMTQSLSWQEHARTVYLNGIEMGWFWLPNLGSVKWLGRVERYLHPLTFFIGSMLVMLLFILLLVPPILAWLSSVFAWHFPVLFLQGQFCLIACSLVHWSRIQRWRATETLYLLPGFNGRQGLVEAFYQAQQRLLWVIVLMILICGAVVSLVEPKVGLVMVIFAASSVYGASALMLGLGCASRNALHISLSMVVVIGYSVYVSLGMAALANEVNEVYWISGNLVLIVLGQTVMFWGKKKLWQHDILSP